MDLHLRNASFQSLKLILLLFFILIVSFNTHNLVFAWLFGDEKCFNIEGDMVCNAGLALNPDDQERRRSLTELKGILQDLNTDSPRPPIFLFPGIASTKLVSWKRKKCIGQDINIMDNVWLNIPKVIESLTIDPRCWLECMKLGQNQSDPEGCKVRVDEGLGAISNIVSGGLVTGFWGITVYEWLIKYLAEALGYDINSIIPMGYDWRLSPGRLQDRDHFFSRMKSTIETAVKHGRRPGIIIAHSMGNHVVDYFLRWMELTYSSSFAQTWIADNLWGYVGLAAPLLGASNPIKCALSGDNFNLGITDEQARELELTLGSTMWNAPRSTLRNTTKALLPEGWRKHEDWHSDIVTLKQKDGSAQDVFGVQEVESGELFQLLSIRYSDSTLREFYNSVVRDYHSQKINQLKQPPSRPPIKHVIMMYGVNLTTEIGYTYIQDNDLERPVLDEMVFENPDNIIAVKVSGKKETKVRRSNPFNKSGDGVVSYLSLSWAQTWLEGDSKEVIHTPGQVLKGGNKLGIFDTQRILPATTKYEAYDKITKKSTVVLEIDKLSHRDVTSAPFALGVTLDAVFEKVHQEMCLLESQHEQSDCQYQSSRLGFVNWISGLFGN